MSARVWIVDDDQSMRWMLTRALSTEGLSAKAYADAGGMLAALAHRRPDVIITDIRMPGMDGLALLERLRHDCPEIPVIVITAHSDLDAAVSSYRGGAFEYLPKPFDVEEAVELVRRALTAAREATAQNMAEQPSPEIIGEAPAMQTLFRAIGRLAVSHVTVLINGESGTGKELVARALHRHSPRSDGPFVALNVAAIPRDLMESELFGHERGAFTGAHQQRRGCFEQANNGSLFLDEIGDMPAELQTRLLRVLADGEFHRVGAHTPSRVDVRIIAATHQDLEQRVVEGRFREDLFHRLNVIRIHVPALRERPTDIPALARHFLALSARELGAESKVLTTEAERHLCALPWRGNVRELENTCRWLTVMASTREIRAGDLPPDAPPGAAGDREPASAVWERALADWAREVSTEAEPNALATAQQRFEQVLIRVALERTNGHRQAAAYLLGWGRNTLTRRIKSHGIR